LIEEAKVSAKLTAFFSIQIHLLKVFSLHFLASCGNRDLHKTLDFIGFIEDSQSSEPVRISPPRPFFQEIPKAVCPTPVPCCIANYC